VAGQVPIIVHVSHAVPIDALELARHARSAGADAISAIAPPFYEYNIRQVADYWSELSRAAELPFYGYVVAKVGSTHEDIERWAAAMSGVPMWAGVKFTHADNAQLALIRAVSGGSWNIFAGHDEGYLAARVTGAHGAIGSTYNIALPLWRQIDALHDRGETARAAQLMTRCAEIVAQLASGHYYTQLRLVLRRQGLDCGLCRWPLCAEPETSEETIDQVVGMIDDAAREYLDKEPTA
jgi:N-acetylneuraminate lyase